MSCIYYLILLATCFVKTFGKPGLQFRHATTVHDGPSIADLDYDILEALETAKTTKHGEGSDTGEKIAEISQEYKSLKRSVTFVRESKEDLGTNSQETLRMYDKFLEAFRIIQILLRNHLFIMLEMKGTPIKVKTLAILKMEVDQESTALRHLRMRRIFILKRRVTSRLTRNLIKILHSVASSAESKLPKLSPKQMSEAQQRQLNFKVTFEKYIFQSIDFMYRSKISTETDLELFFKKNKNIALAINHLTDLYRGVLDGSVQEKPGLYTPNLRSINNDWKTRHIHKFLRSKVYNSFCPWKAAFF
ncbi:hypothetical protein O181_017705 [Austropuccinia psidii MF-1]|uniref:Uncharacterized protein n=1 Tax=Austropuccinia psidii MF-1 TaxID=1389203 RepID=A0A9Q3C8B9_9BASI|nr:hypothetical protein [Austropuccinia psidii MF-1]